MGDLGRGQEATPKGPVKEDSMGWRCGGGEERSGLGLRERREPAHRTGSGFRDPCRALGGGTEGLEGVNEGGQPHLLKLSERTALFMPPILLPPEVVVATGLAAMEPLTVRRRTVVKTAAGTTTTGTWTTAHTPASTAARKASTTMTTHPRSRVQR